MKKYIAICVMTLLAEFSFSQTIDDGKKSIYYEKLVSAEEIFEKIINANPGDLEAYYWLTKVFLEKNNIEDAKNVQQQLENYLASNPKQEPLPLNKVAAGEILLHEGNTNGAKLMFDQVMKETKNKNSEVLVAIARAYLGAKSMEYDHILYVLSKAEKRNKKNPEIFALRGDVYRRQNNGSLAVQAYMQALDKDDSYANASYGIGKIYLTQNNTEMFLRHFNQAITKDPAYSPAYYELYYYYYFRDVKTAKEYLNKYLASSDPSLENEYLLTDFLYASSQPKLAIEKAKAILDQQKEKAEPRLLKLIAYSYDALNDSAQALTFLQQYFDAESDSNYVAKDFELQAKLLSKFPDNDGEVIASLQRALEMDTVYDNKSNYASRIAKIYNERNDKSNEAKWLAKVYEFRENPSNIDLYSWGVAHYAANEFQLADSIFGIYAEKYPEHIHGFYWRAKSNALLDSTMEEGLAIPYYRKVIEMASADTAENKSLLIQAYGYVGAYEANVKKEYESALANFDKILALDPENSDAQRYREILQKWVEEAGIR